MFRSIPFAMMALALTASPARADMAPPPTFLIDSVYLGWPWGMAVGFGLLAVFSAVFLALRRAKWKRWVVIVLCLFGYAAANFGVYLWALGRANEERQRLRQEREARQEKEHPPL